jgi:hypothetical protein
MEETRIIMATESTEEHGKIKSKKSMTIFRVRSVQVVR